MAKILLVEDYDNLRKVYHSILSMNGYQVDLANDGEEALEKVDSSSYDLVLLDMLLPNLSGINFLRKIQPKHRKPPLTVIAISNMADPVVVQEAYDLGVTKYLAKANYTPKELVKVIDDVLRTKPDTPA